MPFKKLLDALTKGPALEQAFEDAGLMHDKAKKLFDLSWEIALGEKEMSHEKLHMKDIKINKLERQVRREIYQYLVVASKPNINASLILISIVIDYERIGDLASNIAEINDFYDFKLKNSKYLKELCSMKEDIKELFDLTLKAFDRDDEVAAKRALELHDEVKEKHGKLLVKLNKDEDLSAPEAMMVSSLAYYLRRINAHLSNINTTVVLPFPSMGFASKAMDEEVD